MRFIKTCINGTGNAPALSNFNGERISRNLSKRSAAPEHSWSDQSIDSISPGCEAFEIMLLLRKHLCNSHRCHKFFF